MSDDLKALQETLANLTKIANAVVPSGRPYYCHKYGELVKETIDRILRTGEILLLPRGTHEANTIKQQWYQGRDYLVKVMDPTYDDKVSKIEATFDKKRGLIIALKPERGLVEAVPFQPWKKELRDWISSDPNQGEIKQWQGLSLPDEDVCELHDLMRPLEDLFAYNVEVRKGLIQVVRR